MRRIIIFENARFNTGIFQFQFLDACEIREIVSWSVYSLALMRSTVDLRMPNKEKLELQVLENS